MTNEPLGSPDGSEPSAAVNIAMASDADWLIDWAEQFLGVTFAPWQRRSMEQWSAGAGFGRGDVA